MNDKNRRTDRYKINKQGPRTAGTEQSENIICGRNAVLELIKSGKTVDKLLTAAGNREGSIKVIVAEAVKRGIPVIEADRRKLDGFGDNHQGVAAFIPEREYAELDDILALAKSKGESPFIVILDHIVDPHNLGAIIRTAECSGAHGLVIPKRNAATLTQTAVKASAGASEHVPVCRVGNLASVIDDLKSRNIWIYAAESGGNPYFESDMKGPAAFVFGGEGSGVSRLVREKSDFIISIPMRGKINSLNVSAAAAVILTEASKQRNI